MDQILSKIYNIGNYSINLGRALNNKYIAIIEIFTQDGIFITDFKMSLDTTKRMYKFLYALCYGCCCFYYDIPLYNNAYEYVEISGEYKPQNIDGKEFVLTVEKVNINGAKSTIDIQFSFEEADSFMDKYFEDLLNGYVDDEYIDDISYNTI